MVYSFVKEDKTFVLVKYLKTYQTMVIYWPLTVDTAETGKGCCNLIIDVVNKYRPVFAINDNRKQSGPWPDMGNWLVTNWIPALIKGGIKAYAHILSPSLFGQLSAKSLFNNAIDGSKFLTFSSSLAAMRWLTRQSMSMNLNESSGTIFSEFSVDKTVLQELKESKEIVKLAAEVANLGIWVWDLKTNESVGNDQLFKMYNMTKRDHEMDNNLWRAKVHSEDIGKIDAGYKKLVETGEPLKDLIFRYIPEDGKLTYIKTSIAAIRDEQSNEIIKLMGFNVDITAFIEKENELQGALVVKDQLFRELHHRIKNNLNMIGSLLYLKSQHSKEPGLISFIEETRTRISTIAKTHDQLLRFEEQNQLHSKRYFEELLDSLLISYLRKPELISLKSNIEDHKIYIDTVLSLGLIVNEIISNILKHAYEPDQKGEIKFDFYKRENHFYMNIGDYGNGKIRSETSGTMGLSVIDLLVKQLKASMVRTDTAGVKYEIKIPYQKQ